MANSKIYNMKAYFQNFWKEILILCFVIIYFSIGFFPIIPIEGDSINIANGISQFDKYGIGENDFSYSYDVQAGSYVLSYFISKIFGIQSSYKSFAILSGFSGLIVILLSSLLISNKLKINFIIPFLFIFLFQETFSEIYYANTNVIATLFAIISFFILYKYKNVYFSALFFSIAIWCRIDIILVGLIFPFIIYSELNVKKSIKTIFIFIILSALFLSVLFLITKVNPLNIIDRFLGHTKETSGFTGTKNINIPFIGSSDIKSMLSFFTFFSMFSILSGIYIAFKKSDHKIIIFILGGIIPLFIVLAGSFTTPKYIYYTIPFFTYISVYSIKNIIKNRIGLILLGILFFQYIIGLNVVFKSKPYFPSSHPKGITLINKSLDNNVIDKIRINIGAGNYINTDDGYRLFSGLLFAPITWNNIKMEREQYLNDINKIVNENDTIYTMQYASSSYVKYILIQNDWNLQNLVKHKNDFNYLIFTKKNRTIYLYFDQIDDRKKYKILANQIEQKENTFLVKIHPWEYNLHLTTL